MHGNDEAWESGPRFSMPSERFLEHTEAAIKAEFELADQNAFKVMEGVRSVLMYEIGAPSATRDIVRLGVVKDIRIEGDHLTFAFVEDGRLTQSAVLAEATGLQMDKLEKHRTHWAIRSGDLPQTLLSSVTPSATVAPTPTPVAAYKRVRRKPLAKGHKGHLTVVKQRITGLKIHQLKHLADLEFNFGDQRLIGFMGPNGCGKTTVLQALACTFRPDRDGGFRFPNFFLPNTDASWDGSKFEVSHNYTDRVTSEKAPPIENEVSLTTTCAKAKDRWTPRQPKKPVRVTTYVQVADCIPEIEQLKTGSIVKYECAALDAAVGPSLLASLKVVMGRDYSAIEEATYTNPYLRARKSFRVVHAGSKYASVSMSAGEQRVIRIIKAALDLPKGGLLLIDEIDLFLHPRALEALLNELDKIAEKRDLQVFFTSHSIHVFSALDKCQLWQIWHAGGRSLTIEGEHPDAIYRLTAKRKIAVQLFCEDDVAHQILKQMLSDLDAKRHCDISCFGSASNGFTMAASVVLTDVNDSSRVVILDGDVQASQNEIANGIARVLSGNSEHDVQRREKAANLVVPLASGGAPEFALIRCIEDSAGDSELARAVSELEAMQDPHRVVGALAERLGLDHQEALSDLVKEASATAGWATFVAPVKSRVSEILIAKELLKVPATTEQEEAKAGDEVDS